jgi:hypothetical protein
VKNIQKRLKTLSLTNPVTVESLYGAILAIFEEHGQVKRSGTPNTPESWFRFLPGPVRLAYIDTLLLYSQFYLWLFLIHRDVCLLLFLGCLRAFLKFIFKLFSTNSRDNLEKLDQDRVHLQASVIANLGIFSDSDVRSFNIEYTEAYRKARRLADRNLKRLMARKARSQFLCWDIIKRLRPSAGVCGWLCACN